VWGVKCDWITKPKSENVCHRPVYLETIVRYDKICCAKKSSDCCEISWLYVWLTILALFVISICCILWICALVAPCPWYKKLCFYHTKKRRRKRKEKKHTRMVNEWNERLESYEDDPHGLSLRAYDPEGTYLHHVTLNTHDDDDLVRV
jgi:hypothetical protein